MKREHLIVGLGVCFFCIGALVTYLLVPKGGPPDWWGMTQPAAYLLLLAVIVLRAGKKRPQPHPNPSCPVHGRDEIFIGCICGRERS